MNQVQNLQHIARELLYLGMDGSPIYTDHFRQLNTEVFRLSEALFSMKGATSEEEAAESTAEDNPAQKPAGEE